MRKKIGKRIGPVPITLVAVFALAAFISVGFWLAPGGNQTAEAQSIQSVVIDVNEGLATGDGGNAVQLRFPFSRTDGDSVSYRVPRIDEDTIADTDTNNDDDNDELGTLNQGNFTGTPLSGDTNVAVVTLTAGQADTPGTRYVYVEGTYSPGNDGTAQDPVTLVFMITVVQNPIEAAGVMVTLPDGYGTENGDQPFPDGDCTAGLNDGGTGLVTRDDGDDNPIVLGVTTNLVLGGDCLSSDNEVEVTIFNSNSSDGATDWTTIVYVTGGDDLSGVEPALAKEGLGEYILTISPNTIGDVGEATITVKRSMSDSKGIVYLVGYRATANNPLSDVNLDDDDTTFGRNAEYVIKVVFLDPPVEKGRGRQNRLDDRNGG